MEISEFRKNTDGNFFDSMYRRIYGRYECDIYGDFSSDGQG